MERETKDMCFRSRSLEKDPASSASLTSLSTYMPNSFEDFGNRSAMRQLAVKDSDLALEGEQD